MDCKTCKELVDTYRRVVGVYSTAQRRFQGLLGDDFKLAWEELKRLREAGKAADEALLAHWRQEHTDLAEKAVAASAGSGRAEIGVEELPPAIPREA